jgi:hypothetical protein
MTASVLAPFFVLKNGANTAMGNTLKRDSCCKRAIANEDGLLRSERMRFLTVIRQVPDAEESVKIRDGKVDLEGRKLIIDTMDEYGVEEALRLRESGAAGDCRRCRRAS